MRRNCLVLLALLLSFGLLSAVSPYNAVGDTLTVIQSPILNVPAIQIPGETMQITCIAPSTTTGWTASLIHRAKTIPMNVLSAQYVTSPDRWLISVLIPQVQVFELYDLRVTASGGIADTSENAVQVLPTRKTNYYFVHVTDLHMPTRIFYPDAGYDTDSTAVDDFRAVVDDINIIRPEFVLITGDVVNEGELENFNSMFVYGWAQRVMAELEVPFFLTGGNHDLGGWNSTPPPSGSARRSWWRYFGWPWLNNTAANPQLYTQDYGFTYGDLRYIGLEGYINYDNWRSNIYGGQSFIYSQIAWLNTELAQYPDKTKVLFYHYDFNDQIDLNALGVDMALWGHIHSNSGSTTTFPYSLGTRSTCNGNRAYRVIEVQGTQLIPRTTIYAGSSGNNLKIQYSPSNIAQADSVMATVTNTQSISFANAVVKFNMPAGNATYSVTGGVLEQVDRSGPYNVCYVRVDLTASSVKYVSIKVSGVSADDPLSPAQPELLNIYPNPFGSRVTIVPRGSEPVRVSIYNLRGEELSSFMATDEMVWDGKDRSGRSCPKGIYFLKAVSGGKSSGYKLLKSD